MPQNIKTELEAQEDVGEACCKAYRFFNLSLDMLVIANLDGYFIDLNPAWKRTLGFTPEELTAQPFIEFIHPEDWAKTTAEMGKLADGIPLTSFENRYRCKDGSYKYLAWTAVPFLEEGLIYDTARDVTQRKQAEESLYQREQAFRSLAENAPDIITRFDKQMRHLYVNAVVEAATGLNPQAFIGKTNRELGMPDFLCSYWEENYQQVLTTREERKDITKRQQLIQGECIEDIYRIIKPDGSVRWINDRGFPIYNSQGKLYRTAGIAEDITERILTEAALQENEQKYRNLVETSQCLIWSNELVANALKHGFSGNTKGTIWICLNSVCLASTEKKGQQFTLVIGNNGMKLQDSQNFYRPKSLGFQLFNALVKQLQGTIEITPSPSTEFKIKFSDINY